MKINLTRKNWKLKYNTIYFLSLYMFSLLFYLPDEFRLQSRKTKENVPNDPYDKVHACLTIYIAFTNYKDNFTADIIFQAYKCQVASILNFTVVKSGVYHGHNWIYTVRCIYICYCSMFLDTAAVTARNRYEISRKYRRNIVFPTKLMPSC